jgi:hypothetical protein
MTTQALRNSMAMAAILCAGATQAQVQIDLDYNRARRATETTIISDLAVNDTAIMYKNICTADGKLYVPSWTEPSDLGSWTNKVSGIYLKVTVLPSKRLRAVFVDGAQQQEVAKGNTTARSALSKEEFNKEIREYVVSLFQGGSWGVNSCEQEQALNPNRPTDLYELESINGFHSLSELLKSAGG